MLKKVADFIDEIYPNNGLFKTNIKGIEIYKSDKMQEFSNSFYNPCICVVLRGEKLVYSGLEGYKYGGGGFVLSATNIPVNVKITQTPILSVTIPFEMSEIIATIKDINEKALPKKITKSLYFGKANEIILLNILKILSLANATQKDREFFSRLAIKEILYTLLQNDESGDFLKRFTQNGTVESKIAHVISQIKNHFDENLDIKRLSSEVGMSVSGLYHHFKDITKLTPLQFQKKIRLSEANFMLLNNKITAAQVAFNVGYKSPSQFCREYSNEYGMPPKEHILSMRNASI